MNSTQTRLTRILALLSDRTSLFYMLALAPFPLIFYYSPFSLVIPFYGFVLLFLKSAKLAAFRDPTITQKALGLIVVAGSFFVHYGLVLIYAGAAFYTAANYTVYLIGLFLTFFEVSALKAALAPLFLIVAATSSSFIAAGLKPILSPFANDFAHVIASILGVLGVDAKVSYLGNTPIISFSSLSGKTVSGAFVYECLGIYSVLVFSIILVVILLEEPSSFRVKLTYAVVGLVGTFALNILRVTAIFLADYFYGAEVGGTIHYILGYALFSTWLACFFYIYSKRQPLSTRAEQP